MVDDAQIRAQAALLHKKQFLRGADQWDIRLDPDYQEFYLEKQREEHLRVSNSILFKYSLSLSFAD